MYSCIPQHISLHFHFSTTSPNSKVFFNSFSFSHNCIFPHNLHFIFLYRYLLHAISKFALYHPQRISPLDTFPQLQFSFPKDLGSRSFFSYCIEFLSSIFSLNLAYVHCCDLVMFNFEFFRFRAELLLRRGSKLREYMEDCVLQEKSLISHLSHVMLTPYLRVSFLIWMIIIVLILGLACTLYNHVFFRVIHN